MNNSEILDKDILQFYYEILACPMRDAAPEIYTESGTRFVIVKELRESRSGNSKKVRLSLCFANDNECAAQPITARQIYEYMQAHSEDILHVFGGVCELHKAYGDMLQAVVKEACGEEIASNWGEMWRSGLAGIFNAFCAAARYDRKCGAFTAAGLRSLWDLIAQGAGTPDANTIDIESNRREVQHFCADELRPFLAGESSAEPTAAAGTKTPDLQEIRNFTKSIYNGKVTTGGYMDILPELLSEVARIAGNPKEGGKKAAAAVLLQAHKKITMRGKVRAFSDWLAMCGEAIDVKFPKAYKPAILDTERAAAILQSDYLRNVLYT